jgi:hypothetical protein
MFRLDDTGTWWQIRIISASIRLRAAASRVS